MSAMAASEAAAAKDPGGPQGPVDAAWLILQRLDDLRRAQDDLRADVKALDAQLDTKLEALRRDLNGEIGTLRGEIGTVRGEIGAVRREIDSLRNWSLGLLLLAILGLLAKLLIPGS